MIYLEYYTIPQKTSTETSERPEVSKIATIVCRVTVLHYNLCFI